MTIPFLDLKRHNESVREEIQDAVEPVVSNSQFILGPAVERFEKDFAQYIGVKHCVGLNSGTTALHLALLACNVGSGDEVITTPHTWISTTWAISYVGAKPVYADIDPVTYNLDARKVESLVTPRTKVILPVHLYGQSADLVRLSRIADQNGLTLIEDAAQAHGAKCQGRRIGSIGKLGCFSFYPGKNLGTFGEGGAVVTNDDRMAERMKCLRDHAQAGRHHHVEVGYNGRMEGIHGAVLGVKLRYLDAWNSRRREIADLYRRQLADVPGLVLPTATHADGHVWHLYVVTVQGMHREAFRAKLSEAGVATGVHYPTLVPFQPAYAHLGYKPGDFPVAEHVAAECVSLPMFPELTDLEALKVCQAVRECMQQYGTSSQSAARAA